MKPKPTTREDRPAAPPATAPSSPAVAGSAGALHKPDSPEMVQQPELPEGWRRERLGAVADFETGKREKGGAKVSGEVPSIGGEHISEDGTLDFSSSPKFISREFYLSLRQGRVLPGDTLVVKDGARTGKSTFVRDVPAYGLAVNEHVFIVRPRKNADPQVDSEFIAYWFRSSGCLRQVDRAYHGLIGGINREDISRFILSLPPLAEQRAIAGVLRTVQAAREACERLLAATRQLKHSLLHHLFTYGPVPIHQADQVPLKQTEIGPMPEHWAESYIGYVCERSPAKKERSSSQSGEVPFIPMSLLPHEGNPTSQWEMRKPNEVRSGVPFREGDVLIAKITPCLENGKLAVACGIPGGWGMTSTEVYPLRPVRVTANFLAAFLSRPSVRWSLAAKMQGTTGRQRLPKEALDSLPVPVPPLSEQREIAAMLGAVDAQIAVLEARRAALAALFTSLLEHLMTGRLRLPEFQLSSHEDV